MTEKGDAMKNIEEVTTEYWLGVLNEIKNRGVEDIKPFMKERKWYIRHPRRKRPLRLWIALRGTGGTKYPSSIASWRNNWPQLSTYFKYPGEIRELIYTTNSIENFNR